MLTTQPKARCVYIAPLAQLVDERAAAWKARFGKMGCAARPDQIGRDMLHTGGEGGGETFSDKIRMAPSWRRKVDFPNALRNNKKWVMQSVFGSP